MKKRPDLKQRLNELRHEPAPPVEVTLRLDAEDYHKLQAQALQENLSVAAYIMQLLRQHTGVSDDDVVE